MVVRNYPSDHFSIAIPSGWVEIPKSELKLMEEYARKAATNMGPQPFNYGFRASAESYFPYIVIQIKKNGRWTEDAIEKMAKAPSPQQEIQKQIRTQSPTLAALNIKIGEVTYDSAMRILWIRMQGRADDGQMQQSLLGSHPTSVGSIQVNGHSLDVDFEQYAPLFATIVTSIQIDDEWKYRERSRVARFMDGLANFVGPAVSIIAVLTVFHFMRKRKHGGKTAHRST